MVETSAATPFSKPDMITSTSLMTLPSMPTDRVQIGLVHKNMSSKEVCPLIIIIFALITPAGSLLDLESFVTQYLGSAGICMEDYELGEENPWAKVVNCDHQYHRSRLYGLMDHVLPRIDVVKYTAC